jgi:hypothetical protein
MLAGGVQVNGSECVAINGWLILGFGVLDLVSGDQCAD